MEDRESRAVRVAVALLLVAACARAASAPHGDMVPESVDVLPELLEAARAGASDEERRSAPLAPGERIDPNTADELELDRLPGIGAATARAIVEAREALGGFRSPDDLLDVRGIGPATLDRIRPFLTLAAGPATRPVGARGPSPGRRDAAGTVDLNHADADELQTLPGIGPALAGRIIAERGKHMFTSVEDLSRVPGVGPATVERLRALARVGPR